VNTTQLDVEMSQIVAAQFDHQHEAEGLTDTSILRNLDTIDGKAHLVEEAKRLVLGAAGSRPLSGIREMPEEAVIVPGGDADGPELERIIQ
jgi:hypothetical protein